MLHAPTMSLRTDFGRRLKGDASSRAVLRVIGAQRASTNRKGISARISRSSGPTDRFPNPGTWKVQTLLKSSLRTYGSPILRSNLKNVTQQQTPGTGLWIGWYKGMVRTAT